MNIKRVIGAALLAASLPLSAADLIAPGAKVEKVAGDMKFTEGPVWIPSSNKLVFSDIPSSKLMQWSEKDLSLIHI